MTQWDFQNKGILTSPALLSFVLKVPLRHLRPSVIYSVPCDRILQRVYLNNKSYVSLASYSCEKSFIWKHEYEAKDVQNITIQI